MNWKWSLIPAKLLLALGIYLTVHGATLLQNLPEPNLRLDEDVGEADRAPVPPANRSAPPCAA